MHDCSSETPPGASREADFDVETTMVYSTCLHSGFGDALFTFPSEIHVWGSGGEFCYEFLSDLISLRKEKKNHNPRFPVHQNTPPLPLQHRQKHNC